MTNLINTPEKIPVVKAAHVTAFLSSINKTVPTPQELATWQKISTAFSVSKENKE